MEEEEKRGSTGINETRLQKCLALAPVDFHVASLARVPHCDPTLSSISCMVDREMCSLFVKLGISQITLSFW